MSHTIYRRKAVLTRIRSALDAFYMLQKIEWDYDLTASLEKILGLALEEIEFDGGRQVERGLVILKNPSGGELETQAGWKTDESDLVFSRTVVQETIDSSKPILCENAKDDPRFMKAESIKQLRTLSLISVPLSYDDQCIGALYIESNTPGNMFNEEDLAFLEDFSATIAPYLKSAITHHGHLGTIRQLREKIKVHYHFSNIIGRSESMKNVFDLMRVASEVDRTVLITGESGSGKERIAHAIHYNSRRHDQPFVVVDCSSLSEHLLESELFGHRRGAFTGAAQDRIGAFEAANHGTLFLDEISDAPRPLQQKLRRVLQEGEIRPVGDNLTRQVDVRVICATNRNLTELVKKGEFMRDLFYRMNKFPIRVPAVRDRLEDIPLLVDHFLKQAAQQSKAPVTKLRREALALLMSRDWRENNVREIRNTVELAIDLAPQGEISKEIIERVFHIQQGESYEPQAATTARRLTAAVDGSLVQIERETFHQLLERNGNDSAESENTKKQGPFYQLQLEVAARAIIEGLRLAKWKLRPAARLLGISPTKLRCQLRDYIEDHLARHGGDIEKTAASLDMPHSILQKKAKDLGLDSLLVEGAK